MSSSPLGGPRSPFIVFDKSHQNDTTIRHPLEPDTDDHFSLQHQHQHDQQRVEESEAGDGNGAWSSTSSTLSDSIAAAFGLDVAARGDYRSNMRSGMSTPRVADRMDGGHEDGYNEDVPLGKWTRSRLEKDLAEALGTPVIAPLSSSSFSPVAIAQPAPTAPAQPVTSAPLAPSSFRRPSITGLGIHALTTRTNSNGSDKDEDDDQDVFHQAIDHFIHPLSTSPHPRVSPRAAPRAIPGAAPITINTTKSPALESSPSLTNSSPSNYSSPPNSPTAIVSLESPTTTMGDVATPILKPTSEDEMKNEDEGQEGEGDAGSPKMRPFYGVGIHGRATVDEYAQEVGDSMQKSPPADRSRPTVVTGTGSSEGSGDGEQKEESKEAAEATADGGVAVDGEDMTELTTADTTTDSITDNHDNVVAAEADDVEDEVMPLPKPATASNEQEEQPIAPAERRPSTLRYGAVGLHALTPSDGYVQDIEESMQRTPPVDLSRHSDLEEEKREEEKREEDESEAEEEDLVPQDATAVNITIDSGNGRDEDKQDANDIDSPTSQDNTGPTKFPEDENEVQTDNETTNTATTVTSAVDRIEVESVAAAEAKSQLATVLRYGAVGLHGKTPFDEYAHEIEESIQRGANEAVIEDRKDLASEKDDLERGSDSSTAFAQGHTTESSSPSTATNTNNSSSTRPLSSVSTLGGESTASDTSSLDYDSHDLDLDDLDSSLSSPSTTPQTSVQKELRTLRQQQRRRRKRIQLVDDAQRKKEQLDRIQAQLERRTLGKIREQVSFWETRGVLEQTVVGAEVLDDDNDDEREDKGRGGGSIGGEEASATMAKKLQSLSLTQEHLRGGNSDGARKSSGEPLSPGNTQSPGYGGMPQLAPRRSLSTSSSASSSMRPSLYFPPPAPQPSEMDSFLSNVD
ncbi:hypothetical protein BGW39_000577 [Mortierella sp. 14UC]|nr:hypothetical protein BGW39_000577 [Mortierella sp. 14UC]